MGRTAAITLEQLPSLSGDELRQAWARCHGTPAPNLAPELLRLGIAYRLQEKRRGGISRETARILRQVSKNGQPAATGPVAPPRKLTPGTRLVRDWHGVGHMVIVLEDGFEYDGRSWRSLTAIAKAITGTHWNGPRFFGLTSRGQSSARP